MKIFVDKMPKSSGECIFKHYHSSGNVWEHWTCFFRKSTVCSLDCGTECEYLEGKKKDE